MPVIYNLINLVPLDLRKQGWIICWHTFGSRVSYIFNKSRTWNKTQMYIVLLYGLQIQWCCCVSWDKRRTRLRTHVQTVWKRIHLYWIKYSATCFCCIFLLETILNQRFFLLTFPIHYFLIHILLYSIHYRLCGTFFLLTCNLNTCLWTAYEAVYSTICQKE